MITTTTRGLGLITRSSPSTALDAIPPTSSSATTTTTVSPSQDTSAKNRQELHRFSVAIRLSISKC
ncbi:hypothetical protein KSP40_PGU022433 [Platanthera guangdongensis]|uniref:Uncharacterized protein n=1 Tax=Platanthera guangdongensis TaxID=2320717 RepID=A0ABR2MWH8_9ASPA